MPPAFNLSQDQTLQFDLEYYCSKEIEENFNFCIERSRYQNKSSISGQSPKDSTLCVRHLPRPGPNAHAYRLYVFKELVDFDFKPRRSTLQSPFVLFRCVVQRRIEFCHQENPLSTAWSFQINVAGNFPISLPPPRQFHARHRAKAHKTRLKPI